MKRITFYLDFISPYAYLAFERLPQALQGCSYEVEYRPVLFAAFLKAHGQLGPAEIRGKREWTYRQVQWFARTHGIPLDMPAAHPFNPLALLRLAVACGEGGAINRYVAETVFRHVWRGGADAADSARIETLKAQLAPKRDPGADDVKAQLKANTDDALAGGAFGVPTLVVDGQVFWGVDALPMLRAWLEGDVWFDSPQWQGVGAIPAAVARVNK
ncbi:2-hydroxychromene-2-carboxylate isomerase [Ramlibacter sp. PS4R-6]|uniref:2-hydroxychromene-2-carboxylate isomerase n=1 Tax=Ramlibacter sp. PS4R-6 TaxID=3133438 RepID=UPI0030A0A3A4